MADSSLAVRDHLVEVLRRELMGPTKLDEVIHEFPTSRYVVGRLAPARDAEDDRDAAIDPAENDSLEAGTDEGEDGGPEAAPPLIIGFNPSSFGLSFLVNPDARALRVKISWGDYRRESEGRAKIWKRYHREVEVEGIDVATSGKIAAIPLAAADQLPGSSVVIKGSDDKEIVLEGVIHEFSGYRAVSLFLVNRRTRGRLGDRSKDERWIFQPRLEITAMDNSGAFVAKDFAQSENLEDQDGELASSALLYRHAREFATGHGVAAGWANPKSDAHKTTHELHTEFIPKHEVPLLVAPIAETTDAVLDMKLLSEASSGVQVRSYLEPIIQAYEDWVRDMESSSRESDIQGDAQLKDAAGINLDNCKRCILRMRGGLDLLSSDQHALSAFRFANQVMWDQRIHSLWSATNRKRGSAEGHPQEFDEPKNRTWRTFQIGFILLNLVGVADEDSEDRRLIDLLWFPTGGGKTEAYLGLAAFTIALRRLRGDRHGMSSGAGVSIIMRYTLRLLTIQQFQRAAAMICACEVLRRQSPNTWGSEPFQIGVWVGRNTTPNTFSDSRQALDEISNGKRPRHGSPVQLVSCPRCGTALVDERGRPAKNTYQSDASTQRTIVWCCNDNCDFSADASDGAGIPVVVVDDEIYRACPTLLVATVDKFARLPFKGPTRALFGLRDRYSKKFGHISAAHGEWVGDRKLSDAKTATRLLPPDLIIQDELHLISGPLGTMVGLYETVVNCVTSQRRARAGAVPAKVISSTATIRRAAQQTHQLYGGRRLAIFPPQGISATDSFFAREVEIQHGQSDTAGRMYVGINAPGSSSKTLLVRVYSALLAAAGGALQDDAQFADPYGTLVGYFNSIRALGGAKRLVEDDVKLVRLRYLAQQRGLPQRNISDPEEITSRLDSWKIPGLLKRLDNTFPRGKSDWPVDVLLATNMISVGVDIDRLGLMVVTGQPKSTAEYIQATSRVGRKHPGLVVTMYNWMGARDLSHYERFKSYHSALYRSVEAISVTPFSSRALDRGLKGIFAAIMRLVAPQMSMEDEAANFDPSSDITSEVIEEISDRAAALVGVDNAALVRARLLAHRDDWAHLGESSLRYSWLDDAKKPPNNSRVLLQTAGTQNEGEWPAPGSLREVEPTAAFFLEQGDA